MLAACGLPDFETSKRREELLRRLAPGIAVGVIAGEFILSTSGIGHEIAFAYDNFDNRRMYALILFVLGIVTVFNMAVFAWERRMLRRRGA
jgi:ABC-type nitrate/sulfonate/bicarbonate transport system permease component